MADHSSYYWGAGRTEAPKPKICAWTVREWAQQTSLSKSYVYVLLSAGRISSVKAGKRRLITTSPGDYIDSLAA